MIDEPLATHCSNSNRDNFWTCPGCYHDLGDVGEGTHSCDTCGRLIVCTVEHEPACHARIAGTEEEWS